MNAISDSDILFVQLVQAMEDRYKRICVAKPYLKKNLNGWLKRLYDGYGSKQPGFYKVFESYSDEITCPECGHKFEKQC